jgi:hypothetical protein
MDFDTVTSPQEGDHTQQEPPATSMNNNTEARNNRVQGVTSFQTYDFLFLYTLNNLNAYSGIATRLRAG